MTTFIAIDPAASTGYAVAIIENSHCEITHYGYIDIDTSSVYLGDWCIYLQKKIQELYIKHDFTDVAVEDYFFSSKFVSGVGVNTAYRTAIHMWARQNSLPYSILNITNWKTIAAGRSTPPKEFKLKYGKEAAKKIYLVESLYLRHNIRLPNHSISESTGKPVLFRYDIADAVGMTIYHAYEKYNCKTFSCSVPVPPDVVFPRASKKHYVYPDAGINLIKEIQS
mgnify:CR=1 FL=1